MESIFENIGEKIKGFAIVSFVIEAIAGLIAGVALAAAWESAAALLIPVAAIFVALGSSYFLYGFGELVENSAIIANNNKNTNKIIAEDELPEL
ncbi:MAG: hypothetical protein IKV76_07230 [Clostridia bacterium]|nr:hypothetical protein [Clostridia bacterium]